MRRIILAVLVALLLPTMVETQRIRVNGVAMDSHVRKAELTLTDAQIKALPTTGTVQLVPAQDANKLVLPISIAVDSHLLSAYTNIDTDALLQLRYSPIDESVLSFVEGAGGVTALLATGVGATFTGTTPNAGPDSGKVFNPGAVGSSLLLFCSNAAAGNFTGGNAANTLKIIVYYAVVDL